MYYGGSELDYETDCVHDSGTSRRRRQEVETWRLFGFNDSSLKYYVIVI